jgi:sugar fermentation stimulation protein A
MKYVRVVFGTFVRRLNRFAAEVEIEGRLETVHVKNTGRLKELLVPGACVGLSPSRNEARKYRHSLISVKKGGIWVNIDSHAPNRVVHEALEKGGVPELAGLERLKREAVFGQSRFDFCFERNGRKGFMEVKGVTLEKDGTALFPDAPTERGARHVRELIRAVKEGCEGVVFFLIQMPGCRRFAPHGKMDPSFAEALKTAAANGVRVLAYDAEVTAGSLVIGKPVPVDLEGEVR